MVFVRHMSEHLDALAPVEAMKFITSDHNDPAVFLAALNHSSAQVQEETIDFLADRHRDTAAPSWQRTANLRSGVTTPETVNYQEFRLLKEFAENPYVPTQFLKNLAHVRHDLALTVAKSETCGPEVLDYLTTGFRSSVTQAVARNPFTSVATLRELASVPAYESSIAKNPSTPVDILVRIAEETKKADSCYSLGRNPNTPEGSILVAIKRVRDLKRYRRGISNLLVIHPSLSAETVTRMYATAETNDDVSLDDVVKNQNMPLEVLMDYVDKQEPIVRSLPNRIRNLQSLVLNHRNVNADLVVKTYKIMESSHRTGAAQYRGAFARKLLSFPEYTGYPREWVEEML